MFLARSDVAPFVTHLGDSEQHERSWHILHSNIGPLLVGCWYRPPSYSESESILSLQAEIGKLEANSLATIIVGDMNIHHKPWLQHSSSASSAGRKLFDVCCSLGLSERVQQPTRGLYLLDLVLSDLDHALVCDVVPGISDHCITLCSINLEVPTVHQVPRQCFLYRQARWPALVQALSCIEWHSVLPLDDPSKAVAVFTDIVLTHAKAHIPFKELKLQKSTHPWLNDRRMRLVAEKVAAFGTPDFQAKQKLCSEGLLKKHEQFVVKTKDKINALPTSSNAFGSCPMHWL